MARKPRASSVPCEGDAALAWRSLSRSGSSSFQEPGQNRGVHTQRNTRSSSPTFVIRCDAPAGMSTTSPGLTCSVGRRPTCIPPRTARTTYRSCTPLRRCQAVVTPHLDPGLGDGGLRIARAVEELLDVASLLGVVLGPARGPRHAGAHSTSPGHSRPAWSRRPRYQPGRVAPRSSALRTTANSSSGLPAQANAPLRRACTRCSGVAAPAYMTRGVACPCRCIPLSSG